MILRPNSSERQRRTLASSVTATTVVPVPTWLRGAVRDTQSAAARVFDPDTVAEVALAAGAALGALDTVVRREAGWAGAWRQRLALAAAAVTARQAGRVEDEGQLRDAVLLTHHGDFLSVGPAGRMLLAWRRLATRPVADLLTMASLAAVLEEFGHVRSDKALNDLTQELRQLRASAGSVEMLTGAFMAAERHSFDRGFGSWLADALLAQRLGWTYAVPLLGSEADLGVLRRVRRLASASTPAEVETRSDLAKGLLVAKARAALRAIDLSADLGRRAERLLAVAPKLRAKAADIVVEKLLFEDAIVPSEKIAGMSDRGLRRLFDRLVQLDAVRELTGRPTFRIYGL